MGRQAPTPSFYGEMYQSPDDDGSKDPSTGPAVDREALAQNASAFWGRLQTQIQSNPKITAFSKNLPNLSQIQSSLHKFENQAEDYIHRSENYFKGAGDFFRDAVRLVPPEQEDSRGRTQQEDREDRKKKVAAVAAGRKDALLHRLRSDAAAVMLIDPARPPLATDAGDEEQRANADTREAFAKFLQGVEGEGGFEGDSWKAKIDRELKFHNDGATLQKALEELGWSMPFPLHMTSN
jgi:hypothetical protein